ncbi:B12-binding domain-containing radical SAM protein [bacterium]|nr:B12-binding domain-containing radical SAM protein [candidate division CSSED10-310 bacterium]
MAKVVFLQNIWFEFLGTMSLVAYARSKGHEVDVLIGSTRNLCRMVADRKPDIIAFSVVTGYHHWALQTAAAIKETAAPDAVIVFGGPHATFFPEIVQDTNVDVVCRGEGEEALVELADRHADPEAWEEIDNLWYKRDGAVMERPLRPLLADLDALPMPARDVYYRYRHIRENPVKRFMSGRGCPYACSFCFNHSYQELYRDRGTYIRKRSIDNMIRELVMVKARFPVRTVRFEDDLFGVDTGWLLDFLPRYRAEVGLDFICSFRADRLNERIVRELKRSGCINVVFGVEAGSERLRNDVLCKQLSDDHIFTAARLLKAVDLNFCTTNILGLPHETWAEALTTMTFTLKLAPRFTWCSIFQPYPRTALGRRLIEDGVVGCLNTDEIDANYHSRSILVQDAIHKSENLHKFFYIVFKFPWLLPLVKHLCALPPNPVFTLIHRISFMFIFAERWNISLWRAFLEGMRSAGFHHRRKKRKGDINDNRLVSS